MSASAPSDVLVVGAGPAGCATAIHLAAAGHHVTVVERRTGTTPTVRGDALVPAAIDELARLDLDRDLARDGHRVDGVEIGDGRRQVELDWPRPDTFGLVVQRDALNAALRARAVAAGVELVTGVEATMPIAERGFVRGASVVDRDGATHDRLGRFLVVADGANSRFGRALGTVRERRWPYAVSTSTYYESVRSDASRLHVRVALTDENDTPIPGSGWVHPLGDGRINVGVVLLSSFRDVLGVNALRLLDGFARSIAPDWGFDPDGRLNEPARHRTPMGGSITPVMGPTFLVAGDAAGMANPFTGHGIRAALGTGRIAAEVLDEALGTGTSAALQRFPVVLDERIGGYHKVGRLTARFLGRPSILRGTLGVAMRSRSVMGGALRVAAGELREDDPGTVERFFGALTVAARFAPSW